MAMTLSRPFANSGDRTDFSEDTSPEGLVSLEKGFTEKYSLKPTEGGEFIDRGVFNELMYLTTKGILDLQNLSEFQMPKNAKELLDDNLNTIKDFGFYFCKDIAKATSLNNYPVQECGSLMVLRSKDITQIYTPKGKKWYSRTYDETEATWSEWVAVGGEEQLKIEYITKSGDWVAPYTATIKVAIVGGGGGGGGAPYASGTGGGGGGGGGFYVKEVSVIKGERYPIVIGAGGNGGTGSGYNVTYGSFTRCGAGAGKAGGLGGRYIYNQAENGENGGDTSAFDFTANGGKGGAKSTGTYALGGDSGGGYGVPGGTSSYSEHVQYSRLGNNVLNGANPNPIPNDGGSYTFGFSGGYGGASFGAGGTSPYGGAGGGGVGYGGGGAGGAGGGVGGGAIGSPGGGGAQGVVIINYPFDHDTN